MATDLENLQALLRAKHPCVRIVTDDEPEALHIALEAAFEEKLASYVWTTLDGVREAAVEDSPAVPNTTPAEAGLYHLLRNVNAPFAAILLDISDHLTEPKVLRAWRELVQRCRTVGGCVIMIDHRHEVPGVVATQSAVLRPQPLSDEQMHTVIRNTVREVNRDRPVQARVTAQILDALVRNLRGLTRRQARQIVLEAVLDDLKLDESDLAKVLKSKRSMFQASGTLEFVDAPASLDQIGGMKRLKEWLRVREQSFTLEAEVFGLTPPRGLLLLGVQGAGKSLSAKAIATAWKRPLLRLDPGTLYDRFVGESEKRLRDCLDQAAAMSPIVLWIDEIEKGFASAASQSTDGGLSQRMFGTLLTWMQEHSAPVFLVATANNIEALPPELLRKGRFDEIFFVDLPGLEARKQIFEIHLKRRKRDPKRFDLAALCNASEGFSGAEIEQAILGALHEAFERKREPDTEAIVAALKGSPPLSVTMAEKMAELRAWAKDRCVPAE